jgi:hypothetical protein
VVYLVLYKCAVDLVHMVVHMVIWHINQNLNKNHLCNLWVENVIFEFFSTSFKMLNNFHSSLISAFRDLFTVKLIFKNHTLFSRYKTTENNNLGV